MISGSCVGTCGPDIFPKSMLNLKSNPFHSLLIQVNPVNISALSSTALNKRTCWSTASKSRVYTGHRLVKAKVSAEGDTLVKEAASSEDNDNGKLGIERLPLKLKSFCKYRFW